MKTRNREYTHSDTRKLYDLTRELTQDQSRELARGVARELGWDRARELTRDLARKLNWMA